MCKQREYGAGKAKRKTVIKINDEADNYVICLNPNLSIWADFH